MNSDLGVWTYENSALVLIDYQKEMFETIRSETSAELADLNVRLLARTAKAFNVPVVLSTVGVKYGINGPTQASILSDLPGVELFRDWAGPLAGKAREVIYWYFDEVTKRKADVGVSEAEKQAVRAREHT